MVTLAGNTILYNENKDTMHSIVNIDNDIIL